LSASSIQLTFHKNVPSVKFSITLFVKLPLLAEKPESSKLPTLKLQDKLVSIVSVTVKLKLISLYVKVVAFPGKLKLIAGGNKSTVNVLDNANLVLANGVSANNKLTVNVAETAEFTIYNGFTAKNTVDVQISGNASIYGDVTLKANGTFDIDGVLTVDGNIITTGNNNSASGNGMLFVTGSIDANFAVASSLATEVSALPIELDFFTVTTEKNIASFEWATRSETNNEVFIIEISEDGMNWNTLTEIAGAGNSNEILTYNTDEIINTNAEVVYARLKQIDFNGAGTTSDVIVLEIENNIVLNIYPNPATHFVNVSSTNEDIIEIKILDEYGSVYDQINEVNSNEMEVATSHYEKGIYYAEVETASKIEIISFIKQ